MNLTPLAANMTQLTLGDKTILFSYKTPVAVLYPITGNFYRTEKKWSNTTTRHINKWAPTLGYSSKDYQTKPQEYFDNLLSEVK